MPCPKNCSSFYYFSLNDKLVSFFLLVISGGFSDCSCFLGMFIDRLIFDKTNASRSNQITNYYLNEYCSSLDDAQINLLKRIDGLQNEIIQYMSSWQKLLKYCDLFGVKWYFAMASIIISASILFMLLTYLSDTLNGLRFAFFSNSIILMVVSGVIGALAATGICYKFAVTAEGSGIPEMKTVLSGTNYYQFFTIQTMWAKYFSSLMVKLSGLGMGYEGAFIHVIAILAHNHTKFPFFRSLANDHDRRVLTIAGISAAIVLALGTPIGALVFTVEMCSINYNISILFKCFVSATFSYFIFCVMNNVFHVSVIKQISIPDYHLGEIYLFGLLGTLQGIMASAYILNFSRYFVYKRGAKHWLFANRFVYIGLVCLIINLITYPHSNFKFGFKALVTDLINYTDLHDPKASIKWWFNDYRIVLEILYVMCCRIFMFAGFSSSAIPFGVFGPGVMIGVTSGRIFGEIMHSYFGSTTPPVVFAVCGASAFICGFTRTFSPLVCMIEMTGELHLLFPMLFTSLMAMGFASFLNIGFFDMIISIRKLPYLPSCLTLAQGMGEAYQTANPIGENYLYSQCTVLKIFELLVSRTEISVNEYIPIVDSATFRIHSYLRLEDAFIYMKNFTISIEDFLHSKKTAISNSLHRTLVDFQKEFGSESHLVITRRIRKFLERIRTKREKFVMGPMGRDVVSSPKVLFTNPNYANILVTEFRHSESQLVDRISMVFERDTIGMQKVEKEHEQNRINMITELMSNINIDFSDEQLKVNLMPVIVDEATPMVKLHYLFLMLGVPVIWIQKFNGQLTGKITKEDFLNFKSN